MNGDKVSKEKNELKMFHCQHQVWRKIVLRKILNCLIAVKINEKNFFGVSLILNEQES